MEIVGQVESYISVLNRISAFRDSFKKDDLAEEFLHVRDKCQELRIAMEGHAPAIINSLESVPDRKTKWQFLEREFQDIIELLLSLEEGVTERSILQRKGPLRRKLQHLQRKVVYVTGLLDSLSTELRVKPTSGDAMTLQNALISALWNSSAAPELCKTLITRNNCMQSIEEWNAAHQLLVFAVRDGTLLPAPDVDGNLYYWRDQLYCTAQHLHISSIEDRNHIFKCLREAYYLGLIDTPDAYIQGINTMESVREEVSVLKRAGIMVLERVLAVESSIDGLRSAFMEYRRRQAYASLLGIAIQLIPIAGGAVANAVLGGVEVVADLSAADVVECVFSTAEVVLSAEKLSAMTPRDRQEIECVFADNGLTAESVQALLGGRPNFERASFNIEVLEYTGPRRVEAESDPQENGDVNETQVTPELGNIGASNVNYNERSGLRIQDEDQDSNDAKNPSTMTVMDLAAQWTSFILGTEGSAAQTSSDLTSSLAELLDRELICPATLRVASQPELDEITEAAISILVQKMEDNTRIGHKIRLKQFLQEFSS